jgi:hypothetical protein
MFLLASTQTEHILSSDVLLASTQTEYILSSDVLLVSKKLIDIHKFSTLMTKLCLN